MQVNAGRRTYRNEPQSQDLTNMFLVSEPTDDYSRLGVKLTCKAVPTATNVAVHTSCDALQCMHLPTGAARPGAYLQYFA